MVKKYSLKIRVSLKRSLGIGFTALLGTSSLGFGSGIYAMDNYPSSDPKYLLSSQELKELLIKNDDLHSEPKYLFSTQSSQALEELIKNNEIKSKLDLASLFDFSPEGKPLESERDVYKLSSEDKKKCLLKSTVENAFESERQRWPKFLGKIEKNPTEILMNVMCEKRDFEVLDFIEKNYDEIKKKLPSDWLSLVKELYDLNNEEVAAVRECITKKRVDGKKILTYETLYGAEMELRDLLGDRNMVFQYFMFCRSKDGGYLSLEDAKNKMDNKEFFNSFIKQTLSIPQFHIFAHDAANTMKDMREKGLLK